MWFTFMISTMNSSDEELLEEILAAANEASLNLLPMKKKQKHEKLYSQWRISRKAE